MYSGISEVPLHGPIAICGAPQRAVGNDAIINNSRARGLAGSGGGGLLAVMQDYVATSFPHVAAYRRERHVDGYELVGVSCGHTAWGREEVRTCSWQSNSSHSSGFAGSVLSSAGSGAREGVV